MFVAGQVPESKLKSFMENRHREHGGSKKGSGI